MIGIGEVAALLSEEIELPSPTRLYFPEGSLYDLLSVSPACETVLRARYEGSSCPHDLISGLMKVFLQEGAGLVELQKETSPVANLAAVCPSVAVM